MVFIIIIRLMKEDESKKYYYIDLKIVSNDALEVCQGLRDLSGLINKLTDTDILNSAVMRIMNLYSTSKFSFIKEAASKIIILCKSKLSELPSKDQVITIFYKCLKSADPFLHLLTINTIAQIPVLFLKENSIYHLLLACLRKTHSVYNLQTLCCIQCLCKLLNSSQYLSKLFCNNLMQIIQLGEVPLNFIVFICFWAKFENNSYPKIVNDLEPLVNNKNKRKTYFYYRLLLKKACYRNFLCYLTWKEKYPNQDTPKLAQIYSFYEGRQNINLAQLKDQQLLDTAYEAKTNYNLQMISRCQQYCTIRIDEHINDKICFNTLLLTFYACKSYDHYFYQYFKNIKLENKDILRWIRGALVTCNFQLAHSLMVSYLSRTLHCSSSLILFLSYCEMHLTQKQQKMIEFLEILNNLGISFDSPQICRLANIWKSQHNLPCMDIECNQKKFNQFFSKQIKAQRVQKLRYSKIYFCKNEVLLLFRLFKS